MHTDTRSADEQLWLQSSSSAIHTIKKPLLIFFKQSDSYKLDENSWAAKENYYNQDKYVRQ